MDGLTVKKTFLFSWKVFYGLLKFLLKLLGKMLSIVALMGILMAMGGDDD